jgi:hypothetical protein
MKRIKDAIQEMFLSDGEKGQRITRPQRTKRRRKTADERESTRMEEGLSPPASFNLSSFAFIRG